MTDEELLIDREEYLKRGVHIGTKSQHTDMDDYIFHVKKNQLAVINLTKTDQQIRDAAEFLADYEPEDILVVGRKGEARDAIDEFSEALETAKITGRFMPGTLTNPQSENFTEPEVVVVTDPELDAQAIDEASDTNIPVVAIADSENSLDNIDVVIPGNNKGENAIATILFLVGQEYSALKGLDFDYELDDFAEVEEAEE
ncbi:30S ribosomal protein S2 [Candidatus Haloredivivus sp. G17]|jgi:small subunit ribosomal protein S2|nr:30S ribosomal protein S2 [Candidatus Haloredivivus sp. G17]